MTATQTNNAYARLENAITELMMHYGEEHRHGITFSIILGAIREDDTVNFINDDCTLNAAAFDEFLNSGILYQELLYQYNSQK